MTAEKIYVWLKDIFNSEEYAEFRIKREKHFNAMQRVLESHVKGKKEYGRKFEAISKDKDYLEVLFDLPLLKLPKKYLEINNPFVEKGAASHLPENYLLFSNAVEFEPEEIRKTWNQIIKRQPWSRSEGFGKKHKSFALVRDSAGRSVSNVENVAKTIALYEYYSRVKITETEIRRDFYRDINKHKIRVVLPDIKRQMELVMYMFEALSTGWIISEVDNFKNKFFFEVANEDLEDRIYEGVKIVWERDAWMLFLFIDNLHKIGVIYTPHVNATIAATFADNEGRAFGLDKIRNKKSDHRDEFDNSSLKKISDRIKEKYDTLLMA